ncbi:hypothetical protein OS493_010203 [Desmophyllum pertusum]|uniref:F5/8 type C domain-containing protein n=1 Tax=Desmophyllum pertusum TaxID=174260 RepID=A0A9X0A355_9CNID|nr:hypothetical protein OS493_010203 [Desmophyllum pertusum]
MQSGKIRDNQLTASSHAKHFEAFKARLHGQSCWRSVQNDTGEFLEINFSSQKTYVNGISTQGDPQADNWTQQYYVAYYWGSVWKNLTQAYIEDVKIFQGNWDRTSTIIHPLEQRFYATAVRIYPLKWHGNIALRLELYSC